jgi:aminopeptidase YwaD
MGTLPTELVGEAYTSTRGLDLIESLVDLGSRMPGTEGEERAAALLAERFEENGLREVETTEFPIPGWWRGSSSLSIGDRRFDGPNELVALPGTPAGEVSGELVDVGDGLPEDFEGRDLEGRLVMASSLTPEDYGRWVHRGEKYAWAAEAGAAGFVFRNHVEGCLPPTGDVGSLNGPGPIPAVGVSKELGSRLVRYCERESVETTLSVECRNEPTRSRTVEGVVGPDTEEEVLVTAHIDAHDVGEGANDNGAGCALVAEVGRLLATIEEGVETRVRLVTFGAEETGLYGAYHFTHTRDLDRVKCVLNLDGAGYSRNLAIYTHGFTAIGEAFDEVSEEFDAPIHVASTIRPHSDHWPFVQRGVPGAQGRALAGESGRGWGHTHADTLDKIDGRDLRDLTVLLAAGTVKLAEEGREIEPVESEEIREATEEGGFDVGMKAVGSWPWAEEGKEWPWGGGRAHPES